MISWTGVAFSAAVFLTNFALPESPYYLLLKGNIEGAKKTLTKFRSKSYNVSNEIEEMMDYREDNHIRRLILMMKYLFWLYLIFWFLPLIQQQVFNPT